MQSTIILSNKKESFCSQKILMCFSWKAFRSQFVNSKLSEKVNRVTQNSRVRIESFKMKKGKVLLNSTEILLRLQCTTTVRLSLISLRNLKSITSRSSTQSVWTTSSSYLLNGHRAISSLSIGQIFRQSSQTSAPSESACYLATTGKIVGGWSTLSNTLRTRESFLSKKASLVSLNILTEILYS